jgi:metallo-beta-lactamase family protein
MKVTFHGAAQTVTGSQHLLEVNGKQVLLDCGLYQGKREESLRRNRELPFDVSTLDAVVLSHAHIDHSGNLPNLVKSGYHGPIYTTPATAHLANIMLMDSGHIQEMDAQYYNEKKRKPGEPPAEPIYTMQDAAQVAQQMDGCAYGEMCEIVPGVMMHLEDAGHILGSAAVVLDIEETNGFQRRKFRLWFSGDIGRRGLPLIRDPVLPSGADLMIMECTYGNKPHNDPEQAYEELRDVVNRTVRRRGKVIIPSFAVGRTQDLVYDLHRMMDAGEVPVIPIIVDSPLAVSASDVYKAHPECFDAETREFVLKDKHRSVLGADMITYTRSVEDSKALNTRTDPMIILSASGMAENGRILHHLKNNIEDPKNTVLIVSWQAPETLGRRLADREPRVKIFGEWYERRAEVSTIGGLSAHAGQDFLVEYAQATKSTLDQVYLVHGEPPQAQALRAKLAAVGITKTRYPDLHETVEF